MSNSTSKITSKRVLTFGLAMAAAAGLVGCSSTNDYSGGAKKYIEGDLEEKVGLGDLSATCDDVAGDAKVGDTFNCTADTADGETVEFLATVTEKDKVSVETTNLITADGMTVIENSAAKLVSEQTGTAVAEGALDCGEGPRVIDVANETLSCALTSADTGEQYETTITLDGLGADASMSIDVAAQPMG